MLLSGILYFYCPVRSSGFDVLECQKCQHDMLCCKIDTVLRKCLCEKRAKQRRHVCALLERELRVQPSMRTPLMFLFCNKPPFITSRCKLVKLQRAVSFGYRNVLKICHIEESTYLIQRFRD